MYSQLVRYLAEGAIPQGDDWRIKILKTAKKNFTLDENNELYKVTPGTQETRLVVPRTKRERILQLAHNHPISGHQGINRTYSYLSKQIWWPGMIQDVQEYIRTCDTCQKRRTLKDKIPLQKSQAPGQPFEHIGIDVIGPLPLTQTRKRYIVVSVDWFTKWPEAKALETADAQTIAEFLYLDIICRHGVPTQITSDRGTEFCNELIAQMNRTYKIKHIRTTAYHPQGNRLVERMNQTIKNTLSKLS